MQISLDKKLIFFLLCLGNLTISFSVAALTSSVPVISQDLMVSDLLAAKIIPYYLIPYGLGALIYAPLTRYFSYRVVLLAAMFIYGFFNLVCATAGELNVILQGCIGMGISGASVIPLGMMLIGDIFEKDVRGRLLGIFFSCAFVSSILGLIVAGYWHWKFLFVIPAVLSMGMALFLLGLKSSLMNTKHEGFINYLNAFKNRTTFKIFCFIFAISFLYHGVHKWYGVYLNQEYGFDKQLISGFIILTVIGGMVGQLLGGVLSDKKGRVWTSMVGVCGLAFFTMLLYGHYPNVLLGLVLTMIAVFWTIGHNGISTILTDASTNDRPIIASLNSSIRFTSGGLGFTASSYFVERSFPATFLAIGFMMFLMVFLINKLLPQA